MPEIKQLNTITKFLSETPLVSEGNHYYDLSQAANARHVQQLATFATEINPSRTKIVLMGIQAEMLNPLRQYRWIDILTRIVSQYLVKLHKNKSNNFNQDLHIKNTGFIELELDTSMNNAGQFFKNSEYNNIVDRSVRFACLDYSVQSIPTYNLSDNFLVHLMAISCFISNKTDQYCVINNAPLYHVESAFETLTPDLSDFENHINTDILRNNSDFKDLFLALKPLIDDGLSPMQYLTFTMQFHTGDQNIADKIQLETICNSEGILFNEMSSDYYFRIYVALIFQWVCLEEAATIIDQLDKDKNDTACLLELINKTIQSASPNDKIHNDKKIADFIFSVKDQFESFRWSIETIVDERSIYDGNILLFSACEGDDLLIDMLFDEMSNDDYNGNRMSCCVHPSNAKSYVEQNAIIKYFFNGIMSLA